MFAARAPPAGSGRDVGHHAEEENEMLKRTRWRGAAGPADYGGIR
jgi:hypothetical protein